MYPQGKTCCLHEVMRTYFQPAIAVPSMVQLTGEDLCLRSAKTRQRDRR